MSIPGMGAQNRKDIAEGAKIGAWTVLGPAPRTEPADARSVTRRFYCVCHCGAWRIISGKELRSGRRRMCASCAAKRRLHTKLWGVGL